MDFDDRDPRMIAGDASACEVRGRFGAMRFDKEHRVALRQPRKELLESLPLPIPLQVANGDQRAYLHLLFG